MNRYRNAVLFVAIMASMPSLFLLYVGITTLSAIHVMFWGGMLMLWWCAYLYVCKGKRASFWVSFILVNVFWWPLLIQSISRVVFVIENDGMERAGGYGSPLAFLIGLVGEQVFFIPLTIAMIFGIITLLSSNQSLHPARTARG